MRLRNYRKKLNEKDTGRVINFAKLRRKKKRRQQLLQTVKENKK